MALARLADFVAAQSQRGLQISRTDLLGKEPGSDDLVKGDLFALGLRGRPLQPESIATPRGTAGFVVVGGVTVDTTVRDYLADTLHITAPATV